MEPFTRSCVKVEHRMQKTHPHVRPERYPSAREIVNYTTENLKYRTGRIPHTKYALSRRSRSWPLPRPPMSRAHDDSVPSGDDNQTEANSPTDITPCRRRERPTGQAWPGGVGDRRTCRQSAEPQNDAAESNACLCRRGISPYPPPIRSQHTPLNVYRESHAALRGRHDHPLH